MALRMLASKSRLRHCLSIRVLGDSCGGFSSLTAETRKPPGSDLVNDVSRVLSNHRSLRHELELSLDAFSSVMSADLAEQVLKRCKNLGFSAYRFFVWAKRIPGFEHSKQSYSILVDILGSDRQFAFLWDFLVEIRELQDFRLTNEMFWLVFRAYSRAGLPDESIRAFRRMVEFGINPSVHDFDQLLYVLCKRKQVNHAQEFFDRVKHKFEAKAKSYSILIRGWGKIGDYDSARKLFDEMVRRGCALDACAYGSLLQALCDGGKVDKAYGIFKDMKSNGVEPDAYCHSIFVRAYTETNQIFMAFRVLDRMKRHKLVPNVFTYNCIIKKLCKEDKVDVAYEILQEMISTGLDPDAWSYNAIMAYHCEHSEVNKATSLISRMAGNGCLPDRHSYNMLLKLLVRVGRFDRANTVWESMEKRGFYPSVATFAVMIHGLCKKKGKVEEACRYFQMMIDDGIPPYSSTIEVLKKELMRLGLRDRIEIIAAKMDMNPSCAVQDLADEMRNNKLLELNNSD